MRVIEWYPIKTFDGYFINTKGEVKSNRCYKGTQEKILKGSKNQQGYKTITMIKNGKVYTKTLHRLLAETFIPNPKNYPCINHIDGNILNNSLNNLEWCTYGYNEHHAYKKKLKTPRIKPKRVEQLDEYNNVIAVWSSLNDAGKTLSFSIGNLGQCCNNKRKTAYGYKWRYVDE